MAIENPYKKMPDMFGVTAVSNSSTALMNSQVTLDDRRLIFRLNESYYYNFIYNRIVDGGGLDYVNDLLGESRATDMTGIYNPVKRIVEVYAENVFSGSFGEDIKIKEVRPDGSQIYPPIVGYVQQIAKWSNFDQELPVYVRNGANLGTVGIRICSKVGKDYPDDDPAERRVWLEFDHPSKIVDVSLDDRGNVRSIITEFSIQEGDLTLDEEKEAGVTTYTVRELMTKTKFERVKKTGDNWSIISLILGSGEERKEFPNALGVCPYVLVRHERTNSIFGSWCYSGSEVKINKLNALTSHIDRQIIRHVKANWAIGASGKRPTNINLNGNSLLWFELEEGSPTPFIEPMVAPLSIKESLEQIQMYLDELADSQPELRATDSKWLSGQSGETIARLRQPAELRVRKARATYEDGLIRALQIAMSWGVLIGIFDFGTEASKEGADKAFYAGLMDFTFEERDALPVTIMEELEIEALRLSNESQEAQNEGIASPQDLFGE